MKHSFTAQLQGPNPIYQVFQMPEFPTMEDAAEFDRWIKRTSAGEKKWELFVLFHDHDLSPEFHVSTRVPWAEHRVNPGEYLVWDPVNQHFFATHCLKQHELVKIDS